MTEYCIKKANSTVHNNEQFDKITHITIEYSSKVCYN